MLEITLSSGKNTQRLYFWQSSSSTLATQEKHVGRFSTKLVFYVSKGSSKLDTAAFTFTPVSSICGGGVPMKLARFLDGTKSSNIARNIASFNVIPCDHAIIGAIRKRDTSKVRELLSSKQASPNDRVSNGTLLLTVSQNLLYGDLYSFMIACKRLFGDNAVTTT